MLGITLELHRNSSVHIEDVPYNEPFGARDRCTSKRRVDSSDASSAVLLAVDGRWSAEVSRCGGEGPLGSADPGRERQAHVQPSARRRCREVHGDRGALSLTSFRLARFQSPTLQAIAVAQQQVLQSSEPIHFKVHIRMRRASTDDDHRRRGGRRRRARYEVD